MLLVLGELQSHRMHLATYQQWWTVIDTHIVHACLQIPVVYGIIYIAYVCVYIRICICIILECICLVLYER